MLKATPLHLDWNKDLPKYWFDNSPFKSCFMNGYALPIPKGEQYFIGAVLKYQKRISDEKLLSEMKGFVAQESWHTSIHKKYNLWLKNQGYDVDSFERDAQKLLDSQNGNLAKLINTICLEHLTVIFAIWIVNRKGILDKMDPFFRDLWKWHMSDEYEHRSFAFDILMHITKENKLKKVKSLLNKTMLRVTYRFLYLVIKSSLDMLKTDGQLWKWKTLRDAISLFFNLKDGLITTSFKNWISFFKEDFHPSKKIL